MDKLPSTINQILDALSKRFGASGAQLWRAYVQYVWASGITDVLLNVSIIVFAIYWFATFNKHANAIDTLNGASDDTRTFLTGFFICFSIAVAIGVICAICNLSDALPIALAPAGAAIQQFINH